LNTFASVPLRVSSRQADACHRIELAADLSSHALSFGGKA